MDDLFSWNPIDSELDGTELRKTKQKLNKEVEEVRRERKPKPKYVHWKETYKDAEFHRVQINIIIKNGWHKKAVCQWLQSLTGKEYNAKTLWKAVDRVVDPPLK